MSIALSIALCIALSIALCIALCLTLPPPPALRRLGKDVSASLIGDPQRARMTAINAPPSWCGIPEGEGQQPGHAAQEGARILDHAYMQPHVCTRGAQCRCKL